MAGRHLYYFAAFQTLSDEQHRELEKVMRTARVIVLVSRNGYPAADPAFPGLVRFVEAAMRPRRRSRRTAMRTASDPEGLAAAIDGQRQRLAVCDLSGSLFRG